MLELRVSIEKRSHNEAPALFSRACIRALIGEEDVEMWSEQAPDRGCQIQGTTSKPPYNYHVLILGLTQNSFAEISLLFSFLGSTRITHSKVSVGSMHELLFPSAYITIVPGPAGDFLYHSLFGNLCAIDSELASWLRGGRLAWKTEELFETVGAVNATTLLDSYFLVYDRHEERQLIEGWLAERERLLPTGHFVEALQISTSNLCNFACSYCFADSSDRRSALRTKITETQPTLTFDVAERAISALLTNAREHGRRNVGVKFLGREPLINWRTIQRVLERFRAEPIQWSITTNGSLITEAIADELAANAVRVVVSLDGAPSSNDLLRIRRRGGSAYERCELGIERLSAAGLQFGISSVISLATDFESYLRFMRRMVGLGAREMELTLVMQTDRLCAQAHPQGSAALLDFLSAAYAEGQRLGVLIHGDWVDPFHRILTTYKRRENPRIVRPLVAGCSATSHQISLESSGELFPCRAMSLHYGHIDRLSDALASAAYRSVGMRTFYNVPACGGCALEGFCQGTCLGSCEEAAGDIYQPQMEYCEIYRQMTVRLFKTYDWRKAMFIKSLTESVEDSSLSVGDRQWTPAVGTAAVQHSEAQVAIRASEEREGFKQLCRSGQESTKPRDFEVL